MKRKLIFIVFALMSILLCACAKKCTCECECAECSCKKEETKELDPDNLEEYVGDMEYQGTLRKEGVFIGTVSEDQKTMRVSHRGGIWTMAYQKGYEAGETVWAVIADNDTPDDYTDDMFLKFVTQE